MLEILINSAKGNLENRSVIQLLESMWAPMEGKQSITCTFI